MRTLLSILLSAALAGAAPAIASPAAGPPIVDPPRDAAYPAHNKQVVIPSHGSAMNALLFVTSSQGPHPTVILMHGLPGNERNLDLAQAIRRAGWDVLTFTYRGAWGSPGDFSIANAMDDTRRIMVAVAGKVADGDLGVGNRRHDHALDVGCGHRHYKPAPVKGCQSKIGRLDDLAPRLDLLVAKRFDDLLLVAFDAGGGEVAEHLADHVMVAGFLEVGAHDVLGVAFGLRIGQAHLPRRPFAEQAIAPRRDPEFHFLVMRELGLERALAILELAHMLPLIGWGGR
jgi:pimeloyl-ACP methyl ester carboxylesterase